MRLVHLYLSEVNARRWWLLGCLALHGIGIIAVIAVVGDVHHEPDFSLEFRLFGYFVLGATSIIFANYLFRRLTITGTEELIKKIRDRYAEMVPRSELRVLDGKGASDTYDVIARCTTSLSEAASQIIDGTQSTAVIAAMSLFVLFLSPIAFAVLAVIMVAIFLYNRNLRRTRTELFKVAAEANTGFFGFLRHVIWGFKEIKMNSSRARQIENDFLMPASAQARDAKIHAQMEVLKGQIVAVALFYLLWATVVFVIPQYVDDQHKIFTLVLCVTYMVMSLNNLIERIPALAQVEVTFAQLDDLQARLQNDRDSREAVASLVKPRFDAIEASELAFAHRSDQGEVVFTLGPCSLRIQSGDVVLVRGGNGSGKSTLLKTLALLNVPVSGAVLWDGTLVDLKTSADYRNLFATVFSDFHLFDRLYGLPEDSGAEINELLVDFGIAHQTRYQNGSFSRTDLSTGQRKRLALAIAMLERRPILLLDEVAAEQDAEFREKFYREIVPDLKRKGHTVLIASHDDRYFDVADQVIHLRDGRIVEEGA